MLDKITGKEVLSMEAFARLFAKQTGKTYSESADLTRAFFQTMRYAILNGYPIRLTGAFFLRYKIIKEKDIKLNNALDHRLKPGTPERVAHVPAQRVPYVKFHKNLKVPIDEDLKDTPEVEDFI